MDDYAQKAFFKFIRLTIEQQQRNLRGVLSTIKDYEDGLVSKPRTKDEQASSKEMYHQ